MSRVLVTLVCAGLLAGSGAAFRADSDPIASLWYRGRPDGIPRADDLAALRAAGFFAVTWPAAAPGGAEKIRELATSAQLEVFVRPAGEPLTLTSALAPREFADIRVGQGTNAAIPPLAWRAIAHGARVISFDAGRRDGAGLLDAGGRRSAWVAVAAGIARQLRTNGALFAQSRPGPAIIVDPPPPAGLDVTLLEARKSWVLVATNAGTRAHHVVAHLPPAVPYALWLNLLDASTMAMLQQTRGPQWVADLEPYAVRVYVIDKTLR